MSCRQDEAVGCGVRGEKSGREEIMGSASPPDSLHSTKGGLSLLFPFPLSSCANAFFFRRTFSVSYVSYLVVKEYEKIRKQAEIEVWGDNPPQSSRSSWRRGSGGNGGFVAPATAGFHPHARGGGGHVLRASSSSVSMSSPPCLDLMTCPTPHTAGSAFSAATTAPRQKR